MFVSEVCTHNSLVGGLRPDVQTPAPVLDYDKGCLMVRISLL